MARREFVVAAAILLDSQGRVLLVGNDWQGFGTVRYTLPGGIVERGESSIAGMIREVKEETGLRITRIEHLAYTVHIEDRSRNDRAVAFAFEAEYDGLLNPRDPDGFIVEARFFPVEEVKELVSIAPLAEPLVDYLQEHKPGRFYSYGGWDGKGKVIV